MGRPKAGEKTKAELVLEYKKKHPDVTDEAVAKAIDCSVQTVYKATHPVSKRRKKRAADVEASNGHASSRDFTAAYEVALTSGGIAKVKSAIKAMKADAIMAFVIAQGGIEKASKAIERAEKHLEKMKG